MTRSHDLEASIQRHPAGKGLRAGLRDRDKGVADNLAAAEALHRAQATEALRQALDEFIDSGQVFTADDVRERAGNPPTHHPNVLPSMFAAASTHDRIRPVATHQSQRRERRGGSYRAWISTRRHP